MIAVLAPPRPRLRAESRSGLLFVVGLLALLVGGLRFWNLGDLPFGAKLVESLLWFILVFVGLGAIGLFLLAGLADAATAAPGAINRVAPEDLTLIEAELPEVTTTEADGLKGETPEELAATLKKIAAGG